MLNSFTAMASILLMQVGPNPAFGGVTDYSAEVQDRPERAVPVEDPAGLIASADDGWLQNCLELVETAPSRAHVQAQLRRDQTVEGEQVVAYYCLGMASAKLELWTDATTALVAARDGTGSAERRLQARFGAMAGNAALAGGNTSYGLDLLQQAQNDAQAAGAAPLAAAAAIDRAFALVAQGDEVRAEAALADARRLNPQSSEAWLLSATLMRRLDRLAEAQSMIAQASELNATDPAVALEAGIIAVLGGRDEAARASWNSVIAIAPDSSHADRARGYLAQLGDAVPTP